jgi:hypothetical protein
MSQAALIIYHSQATSARTRFLRGPSTCLHYLAVPPGSSAHPGSVLRHAAEHHQLTSDALELQEDFRASDAAGHPVYLARATAIDPPPTAVDYRFVSIMEARDLPAEELDLLGQAYRAVLGG